MYRSYEHKYSSTHPSGKAPSGFAQNDRELFNRKRHIYCIAVKQIA